MKRLLIAKAQTCLLLCALLAGFDACKGPQGDIGLQGAAGPTGPQGIQGAQGPQGTANLIISSWTTVTGTDWRSDNDPLYFYVSFDDKNITPALLDKGLVMAYYRNTGQNSVVLSLPSVTGKVSIGYFMRMNQDKGSVNFDLSYFQPRQTAIDFDIDVRWIIVPPSPGGRLKAIDWANYEDVKHQLQLND